MLIFWHRERRQQLRHQHRGRPARVVPDTATAIAQVQAPARGEYKVQEHIALIERALTIAPAWIQGHQVILGRPDRARKGAIVEPDHAHDRERQVAQRCHRREGHAPGRHSAMDGLIQQPLERRMDHRQKQLLHQATLAQGIGKLIDRDQQVIEVFEFRGTRAHERGRGPSQAARPDIDGLWRRGHRMELAQSAGESPEGAQHQRVRTRHITRGQYLPEQRLCQVVGKRVAEEQPLQPIGQRVARVAWEIKFIVMLMIERPPKAGDRDPPADQLQVLIAQAKAARDHRLLQQVKYCRGLAA